MKRLVSRYIHQTKKKLRQGGVNEDDILEIKQDISSLRYIYEHECTAACFLKWKLYAPLVMQNVDRLSQIAIVLLFIQDQDRYCLEKVSGHFTYIKLID